MIPLILWLAFQTTSPEVLRHVQAGMEARQKGQMDTAIAEFRKVTELAPDLAAAFVNLGAAYLENRDYGSAIPPLKRGLELNGDLAGARQMLGYALLAQGYAAEAIPHLEKSKSLDALGVAQLEAGRLPEAIATLEAALIARPNDPDLLYYLGHASGLLSKQSFDALLAAHPESPMAHQALGDNYSAQRRTPEAESEFRETLRLRPDALRVHLALGKLFAGSSQWAKAEEEFRAEAKLRPGDAETAYRWGAALLELGKIHEAHTELTRADALKPEMTETLYSLGKAASLDGDAAGAEKAWKRVVDLEPGGELAAQAHFGLASLYRKQGRAPEAAREMDEFRKLQSAGRK